MSYKKNIAIVSVLIIISLILKSSSISAIKTTNTQSLLGKIIVIDPGHGGLDNGASVKKIKEDELNLKISNVLKDELESRGATVYLTRTDDHDVTNRDHHYSKQDDMYLRVRKIDSYKPDLFISIHLNASPVSSTWGSQVFYYSKSEKGKLLATDIHESMLPTTGSHKKIESADFYVLRCTKATGVLIECGFITNSNERGQLSSNKYHQKLATSISDGIEKNLERILETPRENIDNLPL